MSDSQVHSGDYSQDRDPDALVARVRVLLPSLPPASARVAQLILDDPVLVSRSTLQELVRVVGTSEATIVRTARTLGFRGYPDMRFALATAAGQRRQEHQITGDITATDSAREVIDKISGAEQRALRETAAHLDAEVLDRIAEAIVAARKIAIYGAGASSLIAADLQQKLMRIGLISHAPADNHLAVTEAVLLTKHDVAIGISHSGETGETLAFLRQAHQSGAVTVALTSVDSSTLTTHADHVVYAAGRDDIFRPAALSSRISHLMAVDCLFVVVAQRTYDSTVRAVAATHDALAASRARKQ
ncbi:MurR/RpiR family transcriptional regulator [Rhodococcus sp. WMMA185]|uniref:MurR/RpiR family transcriptional regulator n=1 Tax=Rhodococcus sp. WMMA185 TaxID=679318 RepID=UPI0008791686|nr:MurR/RpiR family transcriptional regulator [Rhodococcus sp. WMMA185]